MTASRAGAASVRSVTRSAEERGPTRDQQRVLDAYYVDPCAARVARALGKNERTVRRIRDRFHEQLDERWRQRDEEQRALADARRRRVEDWIDAGLDEAMADLDALRTSGSETVRVRVAKLRIDLALRVAHRGFTFERPTPLDDVVSAHEAELHERLKAMTDGSADDQGSAA